MPSVNQVVLAGNLTRDPELKKLAGGGAVSHLGLAVNEAYTGKDGERKEKTCFVEVDTWDKQAENCSTFLHKGSSVLVQGKLELDQWETPNGEKRSRLKVRAHRVEFLDRAPQGQSSPSGPRGVARPVVAASEEMPF